MKPKLTLAIKMRHRKLLKDKKVYNLSKIKGRAVSKSWISRSEAPLKAKKLLRKSKSN